MSKNNFKGQSGILGSRLIQEKELTAINSENGKTVGTFKARPGSNELQWSEETDGTQLKFDIHDDEILDIKDDEIHAAYMTGNPDYDGLTPVWIWADTNIFNEEVKAAFLKLPTAERSRFVIEIMDAFYKNNIEYANFSRIKIYKDPILLLEFFQSIKKGDFKKCGIDNNGRFEEMQSRIKAAEIAIANRPIDLEKLTTIWPILRIREIFTESELAALYYV